MHELADVFTGFKFPCGSNLSKSTSITSMMEGPLLETFKGEGGLDIATDSMTAGAETLVVVSVCKFITLSWFVGGQRFHNKKVDFY